jgi:predicted amidophosphoribosyltransferase
MNGQTLRCPDCGSDLSEFSRYSYFFCWKCKKPFLNGGESPTFFGDNCHLQEALRTIAYSNTGHPQAAKPLP